MINLIARAQIKIHASQNRVWEALVNPEQIKKYMFDTEVISDWKEGRKSDYLERNLAGEIL
jgi:uncharacterized protein YndB with AHSA1/START domain